MKRVPVTSWSNVLPSTSYLVPFADAWVEDDAPISRFIPRGGGRSFGDAAYLTDGLSLTPAPARQAIRFEEQLVRCDAGVTVIALQRALEAVGRYVPVFGGTQWVTLGGAVASDIHSKHDGMYGSCGNNVEQLVVVLAGGERQRCSRTEEPELFAATIGGMGLTGYIEEVTFRLAAPRPLAVHITASLFEGLAEMAALFDEEPQGLRVTEWVDLSRKRPRGIMWKAAPIERDPPDPPKTRDLWIPRISAFNRVTVALLEASTLRVAKRFDSIAHRRRFHFGSIHEVLCNWNHLFGPRGMIEYHVVVDYDAFPHVFGALCDEGRAHGVPVMFAAGKRFGTRPRAGLLSFPRAGYGLNFQVPEGPSARRFLQRFTEILIEAGGRVYLAKDSVLSARQFEPMYPSLERWREICRRWDPEHRIQSNLSRRLELKPW